LKRKRICIFVCMLLICTIFSVTGRINKSDDNKEIVFEKRLDGKKHAVFLSGKCYGIGGNASSFNGFFRKNLHHILYRFEPNKSLQDLLPKKILDLIRVNLFIIDGDFHIINSSSIRLENFTGWGPGIDWLQKSFIPLARVRVFGVCDKITIHYG